MSTGHTVTPAHTHKATTTMKGGRNMRDTHVLTPLEAAEQTGLGIETVLKLAANHAGVSTVEAEAVRIDPWDLAAALSNDGIRTRSADSRVGKECVSTCRSGGSRDH